MIINNRSASCHTMGANSKKGKWNTKIHPVKKQDSYQPTGNYYIIFTSRPIDILRQSPGHAFIILAKSSIQVNEMYLQSYLSVDAAYGFYPDKESMTKSELLNKVFLIYGYRAKGIIKKELVEAMETSNFFARPAKAQLAVKINKKQFDSAKETIAAWMETKPGYVLKSRDCITFIRDIGNSIGIRMPQRGPFDFPAGYIKKLRRNASYLNVQPEITNFSSLSANICF